MSASRRVSPQLLSKVQAPAPDPAHRPAPGLGSLSHEQRRPFYHAEPSPAGPLRTTLLAPPGPTLGCCMALCSALYASVLHSALVGAVCGSTHQSLACPRHPRPPRLHAPEDVYRGAAGHAGLEAPCQLCSVEAHRDGSSVPAASVYPGPPALTLPYCRQGLVPWSAGTA